MKVINFLMNCNPSLILYRKTLIHLVNAVTMQMLWVHEYCCWPCSSLYGRSLFPAFRGSFRRDNAPHHKAHILSNWFHEHDHEHELGELSSQWTDRNHLLGCGRFASWMCYAIMSRQKQQTLKDVSGILWKCMTRKQLWGCFESQGRKHPVKVRRS